MPIKYCYKLHYLLNNWSIIIIIILYVEDFNMSTKAQTNNNIHFSDPPIANSLFNSPKWAWLWLIARLYLGYTWISSGIGKLSNPGWVQTGEALKGFWERAVLIPDAPARPAISFGWYRTFLQFLLDSGSYTWFSKLVVAGELLVGIALVLGLFTGIAAFLGGFLYQPCLV
jgi:thiosulfate dehydrogenase [quinone] large subunit